MAGLVARLSAREAITGASAGTSSAFDGLGAARIELAAPWGRVFPDDTSPLVHVIEPRLRAAAMAARTSGSYFA